MSWRNQKISALAGVANYGYAAQVGSGAVSREPQIGNSRDGFAGGYQPAANLPRNPADLYKPHAGPMEFSVWGDEETALLYAPVFVKRNFHGLNRIGHAQAAHQPCEGERLVNSEVVAPRVDIDYTPPAGVPRLRAVVQPLQLWTP